MSDKKERNKVRVRLSQIPIPPPGRSTYRNLSNSLISIGPVMDLARVFSYLARTGSP